MDVRAIPKPASRLFITQLLQQTSFWSQVKNRLGWEALAFDIETDGNPSGDVLVLVKDLGGSVRIAYSPFGPEKLPDGDRRGEYLDALSSELKPYLGPGCIFIRWDLPWTSPYAEDEDRYDDDGNWLGPPENRIRELRMNWGVDGTGLRKAPTDILPPDTILVDLAADDDAMLSRMKPKTRYNIRLSERKGVRVRSGRISDMGLWQKLYDETARRNGIVGHEGRFFGALLGEGRQDASVRLLVAEKDGKPLAAMFLSVSADRATYLYGASSGEDRNLMAPYALQWNALKLARDLGCTHYDLFGVSPKPDPEHPLYGLFLFKSGFGGSLLHRQGAWDYPYDVEAYAVYIARESASRGFHV